MKEGTQSILLEAIRKVFCIIYCRVSSQKQVDEGHGIDSQELRCRTYAKLKGYEVIGVVKEEAVSGNDPDRMKEVFDILDELPAGIEVVVVVDDIKRFSRDVRLHFDLKDQITERGARLESPSFNFEATPEGEFIETIIAAQAQLERKQNRRQVINRMKSRLELGYWCFPDTLPGLKYVKEPLHGKVMRKDEPWASIITEMLEGYAKGRFPNQEDIRQFLQTKQIFGKRTIGKNYPRRLLDRSLFYAGYIEYKTWDVTQRKGHHDNLISFETHLKIQERLKGGLRTVARKDIKADFPLRGFVVCDLCNIKLTAQWPTGNGGKYAYYWCRNKDCTMYGRTITKSKIEGELEVIIKDLKVSKKIIALSQANLVKKWEEKMKDVVGRYQSLQQDIASNEKLIRDLADRAATSISTTAVQTYEQRIEELENTNLALKEKSKDFKPDNFSFRTATAIVADFLQNPMEQWQKPDLKSKHRVLQVCFKAPLRYHKETGFRTTDFSLTYAFISGKQIPEVIDSGHGGN